MGVSQLGEEAPIPKNLKPAEREPFTPQEVAKIIAACDFIGRRPYERLRAKAFVLLLRGTSLRISDFFWSGNGGLQGARQGPHDSPLWNATNPVQSQSISPALA